MADQTTLMGLLKTPSQIRKESQERLMEESLARSQMMLTRGGSTALPGIISSYGAQAAQRGTQAGAGLLRGVAGGIGQAVGGDMGQRISDLGVPMEERQARAGQSILSGMDPDDPASMKEAAKKLNAMGLTGAAAKLNERAEAIVDRLRTRGFQDTAEARAASQESRAVNEEMRREAEAQRAKGRSEREIQDWMEANKDRLLQRVRAEKAERRLASNEARAISKDEFDQWTRQNTRQKQASLLSIAKDPNQLKGLGFSQDQANNISTTNTPQAYFSMIEERMKQLAETDEAGQDPSTAMQNASAYMEAMDQLVALRENPNATSAEIKRAESKVRSIGMTAGITDTNVNFIAIKDAKEAGQSARIQSQEASRVISWMEQNQGEMLSGLAESTRQAFSNLFGAQTPRDVINAKYTEIYTKEVINNLPPGVASDKDVELVLRGTLPANASPEQMIQYMRGLQKMAEARAAYHDEFNEYMSDPRNGMRSEGFPAWYNEKQRNAKIEQLEGYGITRENASNYVDSGDLSFARVVSAYENQATGGASNALNDRARALGIEVD